MIADGIFELLFEGDCGDISCPGQFVNISVEGFYLRRPISVSDLDGDKLTLVVRALGDGTQALCSAAVGSRFDMLSGLGNGYEIDCDGDAPLLCAGGVGVPPMYLLAKRLIQAGKHPVAAFGFNSAKDVFYAEKFEALGCPAHIATLDGTQGFRGNVAELIKSRLPQFTYVFCCGPQVMMQAVAGLGQFSGGQFSFERRMGCGFGACMGCSCHTKYGDKRICRDGPVLKLEEIIW